MPKSIRQIRVEGNLAFVPLTRGYEAVIDAADLALVFGRNWTAQVALKSDGSVRTVYAVCYGATENGHRPYFRMHRVIADGHDEVDHRDGNGLNNRRSNLRPSTRHQNQFNSRKPVNNTSGFKGVSFHRDAGKWQANIGVLGKKKYLGLFDTAEAAHAAYVEASAKLHGEFGRTS